MDLEAMVESVDYTNYRENSVFIVRYPDGAHYFRGLCTDLKHGSQLNQHRLYFRRYGKRV